MAAGDLHLTGVLDVEIPTAAEVAQELALQLGGGSVALRVFSPPVEPDGTLYLIHGDSYLAADGRAIIMTGEWPSLIGWALTWTARPYGEGTSVSVDVALTAENAIRVELTAADTLKLAPGGRYLWDVQATRGASVTTAIRGRLEVAADAT